MSVQYQTDDGLPLRALAFSTGLMVVENEINLAGTDKCRFLERMAAWRFTPTKPDCQVRPTHLPFERLGLACASALIIATRRSSQ